VERELPSNVARFEQLMYLSLGIGLIVAALRWNYSVSQASRVGGVKFVLLIQGFVFALLVLLIWLVARRHKNWARWFLLVIFILGIPSYVKILEEMLQSNTIAGILSMSQVVLQIIAYILIFTGNARAWFQRTSEPLSQDAIH
jgi:hypothetical protein